MPEPENNPNDGGQWYSGDERYEGHVAGNEGLFGKYKSEDEFIKGAVNAFHTVSKRGQFNAEIPKQDDPKYAEKVASLHDALGRPSKPDQYELKILDVPDHIKDRIAFPDQFKTEAVNIALKHRLPAEALNELAELQQKTVIAAEDAWYKARLAKAEEVEKELAAEPNHEADMALVHRLLGSDKYAGLWQELEATGLGNAPGMVRLLKEYAREKIGEGSIDSGKGVPPGGDKPTDTQKAEYEQDRRDYPHSPYLWRHKNKFS